MKKTMEFIKITTRLSLLSRFRYKVGIISDLVIMVGTYLFIYLLTKTDHMAEIYSVSKDQGSMLILIGFIFWQFAIVALGYTRASIEDDFKTGNMEILIQSNYPLPLIYFVKMVISIVTNLIVVGAILLIAFVLNLKGEIYFGRVLISIIFTILSILGMYGMGLILGAMIVRNKNIGSFTIIIQTFLFFVSNAIEPREGIMNYIIPFSNGITIARNFYLGLPSDINLILSYLFINLIWFVLGYTLFNRSISMEQTVGSFDRY